MGIKLFIDFSLADLTPKSTKSKIIVRNSISAILSITNRY